MDANWFQYAAYVMGIGFSIAIVGIFSYIIIQAWRTR